MKKRAGRAHTPQHKTNRIVFSRPKSVRQVHGKTFAAKHKKDRTRQLQKDGESCSQSGSHTSNPTQPISNQPERINTVRFFSSKADPEGRDHNTVCVLSHSSMFTLRKECTDRRPKKVTERQGGQRIELMRRSILARSHFRNCDEKGKLAYLRSKCSCVSRAFLEAAMSSFIA